MVNILKKLNIIDAVVIGYCILTGIIIALGWNKLENLSLHLLLRIVFIAISLLMISQNDTKNKFILFVRYFYPLIFLGFFYSETDYYNNLLFENLDPYLVKLEQVLFGFQPSLRFSNIFSSKWFSELMHFGYFSYYLLTVGVPLLIYYKLPEHFIKSMFIIIFSFCLYYLIFIIFPSIGPQFYFSVQDTSVPKGFLFDKIMHLIVSNAETETGAFPSSHVGMTIIFLILIWKHHRKYFIILLSISIILILSTVYIKAHYAIDIIAGVISGFLFFYLSRFIYTSINKKSYQRLSY